MISVDKANELMSQFSMNLIHHLVNAYIIIHNFCWKEIEKIKSTERQVQHIMVGHSFIIWVLYNTVFAV